MGWMLSGFSMLALIMTSDLNRVEIHSNDENSDSPSLAPANGAPSIAVLSLSVSWLDSPDLYSNPCLFLFDTFIIAHLR